MRLRPATADDVDILARLVVGEASQPSTSAVMRLFTLEDLEDVLELNRVMISSTSGWRSVVVAEDDGLAGMIQLGDAFLSFTPEVAAFAQRHYGAGFQQVLGPRLAAMNRVQATYPPGCLRVSEIHAAPDRRGAGIGRALLDHAVARAVSEGLSTLGLQTLTTNPAKTAFEAWGFKVVETTTDPEFEALTGASGYHLMLRHL